MFGLPAATQALIVGNFVVYLLQSTAGDMIVQYFALWPVGSGLFMPWQVVSYAFLHGSLAHIAFNMFGLYMFGSDLERIWGARRFLAFYFVSVLCAAGVQLLITWLTQSQEPTIGASGGLFGLLLGFGMVFPQRKVVPLIPPIPMPAWLFVTLYGALELVLGVTGTQEGVAHFAHLGGIAGGWLTIRYWRGQRPFPSRRR